MSDELLTKENKFYELNGELERKTKELMKEVNSVFSTTGLFDSKTYVPKIGNGERDKTVKLNSSKYIPENVIRDFNPDKKLSRFVTRSKQVVDKDTAAASDNDRDDLAEKRNSAMVRFFESKAKILETELEAIKVEYKKKHDYSVDLQAENKKIDEERAKLHGQVTAVKETLAKTEAVNKSQLNSLQRNEEENNALRKEIDALKKELKLANQNLSNYNVRLNRCLEDNEKFRRAFKCSEILEKELRDENRKLAEDKRLVITNLEKQRNELLHAFKKQILLVDNLKKQKAHLEAHMLINYTEEELLKLLDWKLDYA